MQWAAHLKGRVESGVKYLKRGFLPLREFRGLADANAQLHRWILEEAGNRIHGSTRRRPLDLFERIEKPHLQPLPDVAPMPATWAKVKVHRDAHVQFHKALYSVPFPLVGQTLWLKATPTTVALFAEHELAVQGILRLAERYTSARLEAACIRALAFDNPRYRAVKTILEKGLDQHPNPLQAFDTLGETYTGHARFTRDTRKLLTH